MANIKKINRSDIVKLLGRWGKEFTVFVPSQAKRVATWVKWDGKDTSFLDWYRNTTIPPKSSVFPAMEEMFHFQKDKTSYHLELPASNQHKQLIFGIRPCDARSLALLDMSFQDGYEDPYYLSRRKNTLIVGLGCTSPYDSCFCTSVGGNPSDSANVDLMLTDIGDHFLMEEVTDKGKDLTTIASGIEPATEADEAKAKEVRENAANKVIRKLETKDINRRLLDCFSDENYWEEIGAKCISCGICTFLCPTCYCFDINDELVKQDGARFRSWDSCQFPVYTRMPMENPRIEKGRRVRQKVCHKFLFYPMNFEATACVGCGRCIRQCPVNWDITQVLNSLPAKVA